jgi:hypothetical protein
MRCEVRVEETVDGTPGKTVDGTPGETVDGTAVDATAVRR